MSGISPYLYNRLRKILPGCGMFGSDSELRAVFIDARLSPWRDRLPQASNPASRVEAVVDFLYDQYNDTQENALILLLRALRERVDPGDATHWQLAELIGELERAIKSPGITEAGLSALRADYLAYLRRHLAYLDLGGIAPKVANRTVKLPIKDIFVPIEASRELDVQQTWWQVRNILAGGRDLGLRPRLAGTSPMAGLSEADWEEVAASLSEEGETAAWRIFRKRLLHGRLAKNFASLKDIFATPRAVLLGHPGTGKSTTLRYAAYAVAAGLDDLVGKEVLSRLPILVRLVDYAKARNSDPTFRLRNYVRDLHDQDRALLFRKCLEAGECLVMLDGLDEVIDPRQRAEIADQVEALVADYPDNHYLITSRIVGYEAGRLTGDFVHFTLSPLPESSIHNFVQKWYEAIEQESGVETSEEARTRADELCRAIEERLGIRRLAENPLLLTIIALVNWRGHKLPNRRVEVYRHAAETLVESWPSRWRGVEFDAEEVLSFLEPVAYRVFGNRSSEEIGQSDLLPLLTQAVVEIKPGMTKAAARAYAAGLLPRLSEHSGLFLERGFDAESGQRVFGFLHLTLAEYLAARYLAGQWEAEKDEEKRRAFLARYAHVPRWREVVLLMAEQIGLDGRRVRATQMLADLLQMEAPYESHLHRNLLLAGQCLADDLRVEPSASAWILDRLVELMLETPIGPLREQIVSLMQEMIGTAYEDALVDRLLARLEDKSESVRANAVWALGAVKSERAVKGLLDWLEAESEFVRASAGWALGEIKSERAVEGLLAQLEAESQFVRARAAEALGEIKSERAVESLLARLEDESEFVRARAAEALGAMESERAVEGLLKRLDFESELARASAALALGAVKSKKAIKALLARLEDESESVRSKAAEALGAIESEKAVDGLLARLEDKSEFVLARTAWALGEIKSPRTVKGLLACLEDPNTNVRGRAAWILGKIESEQAVDGLLARLEDRDANVRSRAAWALGATKSERAVEGLLIRLEDKSVEIRASAAWTLGEIKSERAVDGLLARLEDESEPVRANAAWALGQIRSERAIEGLLARLEDESESVRARAAEALGVVKSEQAVEGLLARLEDESEFVLTKAAEALGAIQSERAVEGLLVWLENQSAQVRASAAVALGAIKSERAVDGLVALLEDRDADVRHTAVWALGEIKSERAVDSLLARLRDQDADVRASAARALGDIKSERAVDGLVARLEDKSSKVRARAAEALGEIKSRRAVASYLPWLSQTEFLRSTWEQACDWAYRTILETLAHHAPDPGTAPPRPAQEPTIPGPWSRRPGP